MKEFKIKLNLSMFDMNTQVTTQNSLSPEMKTFYDKNLIRLATPKLVHDQFAQKRNIPKNGGKTIEFRRFESLPKALTPLTEGVTPDGQNLTVTAKYAEVKQFGGYVTLSDILEMSTIDNIQVEAQEILADQAGRTLDTITRDVMNAGTNVVYAGGYATRAALVAATGDQAGWLKVIDIQKAVRNLKVQNAQPVSGGYYVAIIHPDVDFTIKRDPEWISASQYAGSEQIFAGEIGRIAGVRFIESTEAKVIKVENTPVYMTMILGANAYGTTEITGGGLQYIATQLGSGGSSDPLAQRATMGWKALKTAERLVEQYMIRIESKSGFAIDANGQYTSSTTTHTSTETGGMIDNAPAV